MPCRNPGNRLAQVICGHGFLCDHDKRLSGPRGNRLEGRLQIVCERVNCAGHNEIAPIANDERVAVGIGARCRPTAMVPPAPPPFSMTMGWPSDDRICSIRMRVMESVGPPAGAGTIMVIGRDG